MTTRDDRSWRSPRSSPARKRRALADGSRCGSRDARFAVRAAAIRRCCRSPGVSRCPWPMHSSKSAQPTNVMPWKGSLSWAANRWPMRPGAAILAGRGRHELGLNVMVFTGYTLAEGRQLPDPAVGDLLAETDILVDGPYMREQPEKRRRWIGSANQQVHFLSDRCRVRTIRAGFCRTPWKFGSMATELTVNGFPAPRLATLLRNVAKPDGP